MTMQYCVLTEADQARLHVLRDRLWDNFYDDETCRMKEGQALSLEEWEWLNSLTGMTTLWPIMASGFTTPMPFVLIFEGLTPGNSLEQFMMVHPSQMPKELEGENIAALFRLSELNADTQARYTAAIQSLSRANSL